MSSKWELIAELTAGNEGTPGSQYRICEFHLYRRGERWRATAEEDWGSNQGYRQSNGRNETEGRAGSPEDAIGVMQRDVLAWAGDNTQWRAELATAMRQLAYAVEEAAEEDEDEGN